MVKKPAIKSTAKRKLKVRVKPAPKAKPKSGIRAKTKPSLRRKKSDGERRVLGRRRLIWAGKMKYGGYSFDCRIFDLSLGGAKIELDLPLKRGTLITLQIPDVGILVAKVAWARDGKMALAFLEGTAAIRKKLAAKAAMLGLA